jgi:hypothetical protein
MNTTFLRWAKDAANTAVEWAKANAYKATPKEIESFGIGFEQGYRQAIVDLRMHNLLKKNIAYESHN